MPNWVYNKLIATGDADEIARMREQLSQPFVTRKTDYDKPDRPTVEVTVESPFSFWNIKHPAPEELDDYFTVSDNKAPEGNWYNWNNRNWGVKWDANSVEVTNSESAFEVYFETPWGPPTIIEELSRQYPSLHFELSYEEESGWGGVDTYSDGIKIEVEFYNEPNSHAEVEARGKECYCEGDYAVFDDCPVTENKERAELEAQVMEDLLDLNTQVV